MTIPYPEPDTTPEPTRPLEAGTETSAETTVLTDEPAAVTTETAPAEPGAESTGRPMRMRTVVLGLVLLVIAGAVLIGELTDLSVDPGAVILALMIGAGVLLIAGARRS